MRGNVHVRFREGKGSRGPDLLGMGHQVNIRCEQFA